MKLLRLAVYNMLISGLTIFSVTPANAFDYFQPLPHQVPIPKDNPLTPEKIELGKQLFFDRRLSKDGTLNCDTCHNVMAGGEDGRSVSIGYKGKQTKRNAPTLWNIGFQTVLFWEGRSASLEDQFRQHVLDATITGYHTEKALLQRLAGIPGYRQAVSTAFGPETEFNLDVLAKAVACYERTLTAPDSPFDHYIKGDQSTLSETAKRGMEEFQEVGCVACHFGVNFAGPAPGPALKMGDPFFELFPNRVGTKYDKKYHLLSDLGLYEVDKNPEHKRMWRVPPLRNIAVTAPYFHNGSAKTLREAVKIMGKTQENMDLSDSQIDDIVAFLNSLTGKFPLQSVPHLPPTVDDTVFPVKLR